MSETQLPYAIILGRWPQRAGSILQRRGIKIVVVDDPVLSVGREMSFPFTSCPPYGPNIQNNDWRNFMIALSTSLPSSDFPVLFATTDRGLHAIARFYDDLSRVYALPCPAPDQLLTLIDKVALDSWASQHGIPMPQSRVIKCGTDILKESQDFPMPCVIKPSLTCELDRTHGTKVFLAKTREQALVYVRVCHDKGLNVVLQPDLSPLSDIQWSLCGVCDRPGHLSRALLARKLRQVPFGVSTATETVQMDARILNIASNLCAASAMWGLFEIELRQDSQGNPVVIDVNPRIWRQIALPTAAGMDLLYSAYRAALASKDSGSQTYKVGVGWIRRTDISLCLRRLVKGKITAGEVIRSWYRVRVVE